MELREWTTLMKFGVQTKLMGFGVQAKLSGILKFKLNYKEL
jgi:hypothetical protein